ncbi:SAP domain-containing like ribonucleoprotein, putative [Babesia ovata]|uniref:SAP domain-containing like ribonucleoprotein, putative n=1 Tax=Babesia ovata TaxID=189622 RepID=A0A2H6KE26_9APIC|nr:SAP domain-containing like ribonucleoprotein, putative [Babesia ovata]GBE61237.1 SAP domain-containing like ribonucleoprotein, putative [Babesia ovata]
MEEEELRKKTLVELRALLSDRNMKTTGKKEELINRLLGKDSAESTAVSSADVTGMGRRAETKAHDEVEPEESKEDVEDDDAVKKGTETPSPDAPSTPDGVSIRASPSSPTKTNSPEEVVKEEAKQVATSASMPSEIGALSMEERMALRAKRFNITSSGTKTAEQRTQSSDGRNKRRRGGRSGMTQAERNKRRLERMIKRDGVKGDVPLDDDERARRQKRLERFGAA